MRKKIYVCMVLGALLTAYWAVGVGSHASALEQGDNLYPWLSDRGVSIISKSSTIRDKQACSSRTETITFRDGYVALACVFGDADSTRVAWYVNQGGLSVLGIAYPGEDKYLEVYGVCEGSSICVYSASRDTLIDSRTSRFYSDFAKHLVKMTNPVNGLPYYQFSRADLSKYISVSGPMVFNAAAVSTNGKWVVVEAYEYGFVRVDLDTFHERRVAISGARYGVANDPRFELAISNSGREFVAVGERTGISLYQIDNYCGDVLNAQSAYYFVNPVVPCRLSSYNTDAFPGFKFASSPVFSNDGTRLGLTIQTTIARERVVAAPTQTTADTPGMVRYVALGDSYTSGEGEVSNDFYKVGTDQYGNKCHLSSRSYPYLMAQAWGFNAISVACSGAQIRDIFGVTPYYGQKDQITKEESAKRATENQALADFTPGVARQIAFVSHYQPDVISIGIGGNDAGMMDKLNTCIGPGVCEWAKDPAMRLASAQEIQRLYEHIRGVIAAVRSAAPNAKVLFIGYPKIINEVTSAHCSPVLGLLLSSEERQFMDESIAVLNNTIKAAVLSEGGKFIDVEDALFGHRLCEGGAKAMNGLRGGDDIAPIKKLSALKLIGAESFHPTPYGHSLVASHIARQVPNPVQANCPECTNNKPSSLRQYWTQGTEGTSSRRLIKRIVTDDVATAGRRLLVNIPAQLFRPLGTVRLELHSESTTLSTMLTDDAGGGAVEITIPRASESGYHTLHLLGESRSGDTLDVYQVVQLVNTEDDQSSASVSMTDTDQDSANKEIGQLSHGSPVSILGVSDQTSPTTNSLLPNTTTKVTKTGHDNKTVSTGVVTAATVVAGCILLIGIGVYLFLYYRLRSHRKVGIIEP